MSRKVVYAGSFDPITSGHLWMIEQGADLFDQVVVAIGVNPDKGYTFSLDEREAMLKAVVEPFENVQLDVFANQFLVHYAHAIGARYILRGIRSEADYQYERAMRHVNSDLNDEVRTIFLMPPRQIAEVSSSLVKSLVGPEGWEQTVRQFLPEAIRGTFVETMKSRTGS